MESFLNYLLAKRFLIRLEPEPFHQVKCIETMKTKMADSELPEDPVIANATIDRIFDQAETLVLKGTSYRLKGKIQVRDIDTEKLKH